MDTVVKIIGVVFVIMGILYLLKPDIAKGLMEFFIRGKRIYFAGLIRFALAIIFLLGARECDVTWVITTFGILFIISGLLVFILGPEKFRPMMEWYKSQPAFILRVISVIVLAVGAVIVYSA